MRWGILSNGEIGKKSLTNKNISEEKLHYCTNENTEGIVKNEVTNKMSGNEKSSYVTRKKEYPPLENKNKLDFSELDKEFENG